jgi:hypothetical protein
MILSVREVARIAAEAATAASKEITVIGVRVKGGSSYSEILVLDLGCHPEPCHHELGVFRDGSEADLRAEITDSLRRHLQLPT